MVTQGRCKVVVPFEFITFIVLNLVSYIGFTFFGNQYARQDVEYALSFKVYS